MEGREEGREKDARSESHLLLVLERRVKLSGLPQTSAAISHITATDNVTPVLWVYWHINEF